MVKEIEIPLKDKSSNVIITIWDEPEKQYLIMLHSLYFSEQFGLDTTGVSLELNESTMILRMTSTKDVAHQSLYLHPARFNELQLFFKKAGFPMNLNLIIQELENNGVQSH